MHPLKNPIKEIRVLNRPVGIVSPNQRGPLSQNGSITTSIEIEKYCSITKIDVSDIAGFKGKETWCSIKRSMNYCAYRIQWNTGLAPAWYQFRFTDSIKINSPGHNIRMNWTNFRQPTAHVQQNDFEKTLKEGSLFSVKLDIFESAVWALKVDMNEKFDLI